MKIRENRPRRFWALPIITGLCLSMAFVPLSGRAAAGRGTETASDAEKTEKGRLIPVTADGLFSDSDLGFLNGTRGDGSEEKPYRIATRAELAGLSVLAAKGMRLEEGLGVPAGDYAGSSFILARNIDLGGMDWLPIGADGEKPFKGRFDGNGKTVSNFRLNRPGKAASGFFGTVADSEIKNLTVKPGKTVTAGDKAGILAGEAINSTIRNVRVSGTVSSSGPAAGGVAGEISEGSVIENAAADHVAVDTGSAKETYAGGIVGKASGSLIADCTVNTGDTRVSRIRGGGYVGGITGFQNDTDIYNVHVMGTIGTQGSQSAGGVTGNYASGKIKVARFEGEIASTGLGSAAREGTFIGTHDAGFHFRYGTQDGADLAYLFADEEEKIAAGICGCDLLEDNTFTYGDHIGFWHKRDNFYTLVQGANTRPDEKRYFYEELENGTLHIADTEISDGRLRYTPDHFAPSAVGRPVRGYLLSVLQIDTIANAQNYYDVASLSARGESAYCQEIDKANRGAVAAGDVVTVVTGPKNTDEEKYQMAGTPTYTNRSGKKIGMTYQTGGSYSFIMPKCDTEVTAEYVKVAAGIRLEPEEFAFRIIQERNGDRKKPSTVTTVRDADGRLIARYINGGLEKGTTVQEVRIASVIDENNDVADGRVSWSTDDPELVAVERNGDEDAEGYTEKSASVRLNLKAGFFTGILERAEREQAKNAFRYPIPDVIYGNGNQGGIAVLTAKTRPAASFEGKPLTANCRIPVTFQIRDRTQLAVETAAIDKTALVFTVTRELTGDRRRPKETLTASSPQTLTASFLPDGFDRKEILWRTDDPNLIRIEAGNYKEGGQSGDYRNASVSALKETKWIQNRIAADDAAHAGSPYALRNSEASRKTDIFVTAVDALGNRRTAKCEATVKFVTVDRTRRPGSSGSSGGGSGRGVTGRPSRGITTFGTTKAMAETSKNAVAGTWIRDGAGRWLFTESGRTYAGEWAYIHNPYASAGQEAADWFFFDADGGMHTGWLYDEAAVCWYYLNEKSDGTLGRMYTGWNEIGGRNYYFDTGGRMATGWRWIDGSCFYFDMRDGYLYRDTVTPDGYTVNGAGEWTVGGVVQRKE